jgi:hypothetical protein
MEFQSTDRVDNILVAKVNNSEVMNASLHIQLDRFAKLAEAHTIANSVEESSIFLLGKNLQFLIF